MADTSTNGQGGGRPRRRRARALRRIGLAVAAAAVAGLVVYALQRLGFARIGHALASVRPGWIAVALALMASSLFLRAMSWFAVLRAALPDVTIGRAPVLRGTMIGVMTSAVLPGRLGEPSRAFVVARRLGDARRYFSICLGTIFSQTIINLFALGVLAAITFASVAIFRGHEGALVAVIVVPAALVAVVVGAPRLLAQARRARWRRIRRAAEWLGNEIVLVRRGLRVFRDPRQGAIAVGAQLGAWALQTFAVYAVIRAFGFQHQAGIAAAAAVLLAVNVSAVLPATPSNVGIFQAACIVVLTAYGVGAGRALAYGIVLQAVEVVTALALGIPALLGEGLSWGDIRRGAQGLRGPAANPDYGDSGTGGHETDDPERVSEPSQG